MTKTEKINCIKSVIDSNIEFENVYEMLENIGDVKYNYTDYMITEPIKSKEELKRISNANYELCTALLTMVLREERFSTGSFEKHVKEGSIKTILNRMLQVI